MNKGKPDERLPVWGRRLPFWPLLAVLLLWGWFTVTGYADFSGRRQIIVFAAPESESGRSIQRSVEALRCQLVDRDTDVRFVDVTELPDADAVSANNTDDKLGALADLVRVRSEGHPDFEVVLIGKDGGVKARTSDLSALEDFLALIDTMPMRRAEMRARGGADGDCE